MSSWLTNAKASAPADLKDYFQQFQELYDKKLWHQLTISIEKFSGSPTAAPLLLPLYENFISTWEKHMNTISLVQYIALAAKNIKDPHQALTLMQTVSNKVGQQEAYLLATLEVAHYKQACGDLAGCKSALEASEKLLEKIGLNEPIVNATFYKVSANYYKAKMAYPQYYHHALLFLSSVQLESLSIKERQERAFDLAMSALLGEGLYNFGELLMHPILDSLKGTVYEWLRQLLFLFNSGNMEAFDKISRSGDFLKQQLLVNSLGFLRQKLCLMTMVESVFKRSKEARSRLSFNEISRETRVAPDEVEHLVMKALSLGLIKGKIDQVESIVEVTWVQPRVLDKQQIGTLSDRLQEWSSKVLTQIVDLEKESSVQSLLVQ